MKVLVVGNGGREHALLWRMRQDRPDAEFFCTQPNAGAAALATSVPIAPTDIRALSGWAAGAAMDLVVVGPEAPLAMGLVDQLRKDGIPAFGPNSDAARIESSKAFSKGLMAEAGVPTADYGVFEDLEEAERFVLERGAPIVVKASGLAAGKGAVVCETVEQAQETLHSMMADRRFGEAGRQVVIEEFMEGEELSVFAICDGSNALILLPSQDHKRIGEGDTGPNTGGMGAYAPVSLATPALLTDVRDRVFLPTLGALADAGCPFRGLLYAGLMLTDQGPRVVEFNCRFGDPETQVVLPLLASPLLPLLNEVAVGGDIGSETVQFKAGSAVTTILASQGYPAAYRTGFPIEIPSDMEEDGHVIVFHGGTRHEGETVLTHGGRVLAATGLGPTLEEAAGRSKDAADRIQFEGKLFRRDIGWRESARRSTASA